MSQLDNQDFDENNNGLEPTPNPKNNLRMLKNPFAQEKTPVIELETPFEQNVVLKQSNLWSRLIAGSIMGFTVFGVLWAGFANIEQVVPAQGQIKPEGKVKEIPAPINGVVQEVHVEDGDKVEKGQLLVTFDTTTSKVDLQSQEKILNSLSQENKFYGALMQRPMTPAEVEAEIAKLQLPPEIGTLARSRTELISENQMFKIYLQSKGDENVLKPEQKERLSSIRSELNSRSAAAKLEVDQLQKQVEQIQVKLVDARAKLATDKQLLAEIRQRNEQLVTQAQDSLQLEKKILQGFEPLRDEGAIATTQIEKQRQEVNDRYAQFVEQRSKGEIDYRSKQQDVESSQAQVDQLIAEERRLELAINQAQQKFSNTIDQTDKEIREQMASNNKQLAQIDSQLSKLMVDNNKQIAESNTKISSAEQTLKYQEIRSPVSGTVFDLKAFSGYVQQPSQTEPLMKIVPDENFLAEVYITNKDIGFVRGRTKDVGKSDNDPMCNKDSTESREGYGQAVDVRIDSFPYSEFGDIKGEVIEVGSDALPPDQINQFYRFPAKIRLCKQYLKVNDRQINLQSGMSVTGNIKIRENRSVLSIFTELFTKNVDSLKGVR